METLILHKIFHVKNLNTLNCIKHIICNTDLHQAVVSFTLLHLEWAKLYEADNSECYRININLQHGKTLFIVTKWDHI